MPLGEHMVRCVSCGNYFRCGDCIPTLCPVCECRERGHLWVGDFCGRCAARRPTAIDRLRSPEDKP